MITPGLGLFVKPSTQFTSIGGQAVIEGVMMRSPHFIAVAVRRADGKIMIRQRPYQGIAARVPLLKKPVLRGVTMLIESMMQGMDALSYSANAAAADESATAEKPEEKLSNAAIIGSMALAFAMGMGLFVGLPHLLTALLTGNVSAASPIFHLVDGAFKMGILVAYVYLIALMKDIHRVFQYHGAEHKSIYAFEAGEELTVENARRHTTLHPRCGTSFLLFLVLISVLVFSVVFPLFGLSSFSSVPILNHLIMIFAKILLMFPVAGLAYEFIKYSAGHMEKPIFRVLVWPGLILQKLTTREPDDEQLAVALASLRQVLRLEKGAESLRDGEVTIAGLGELALVTANAAEFPER